jgi:undecaprenyl-diphosphatase
VASISKDALVNERKERKKSAALLVACIAALCAFLALIYDVTGTGVRGSFLWLDHLVNSSIMLMQSAALTKVMIIVTSIGNTSILIILSLMLLSFLAYKKRWRQIALFAASMIGALVIELLAKLLVHRARPDDGLVIATGFSYPSGHATMALIFFLLAIYVLKDDIRNKFWKDAFITVCIVLPLLIGFSRIYLNVHWLSDVLGGFCIAIFWASLVMLFSHARQKKAESI